VEYKIIQHLFLDDGKIPEVRLTEKPAKARTVAEFAFGWGVEEAAKHYEVSKGAIYAAMSFYEDNRETIEQAYAEDDKWIKEHAINGKEAVAKIKQRKKQADKTNSG
jgi:hypothetical protein